MFDIGTFPRESLLHPIEGSGQNTRKLATEPVTRADGTMVVGWIYPELKLYEVTTDFGNIKVSEALVKRYDTHSISGIERIARIAYRHGSANATARLQRFFDNVSESLAYDISRAKQARVQRGCGLRGWRW